MKALLFYLAKLSNSVGDIGENCDDSAGGSAKDAAISAMGLPPRKRDYSRQDCYSVVS